MFIPLTSYDVSFWSWAGAEHGRVRGVLFSSRRQNVNYDGRYNDEEHLFIAVMLAVHLRTRK